MHCFIASHTALFTKLNSSSKMQRGSTMSGYWQKFTSHTISRRRALAATGGAAAAAAFLAACGGSDSSSSGGGGEKGATSNLYKPADTSASAKAGGVVKHWAGADITHFDALASNSASTVGNAS